MVYVYVCVVRGSVWCMCMYVYVVCMCDVFVCGVCVYV